MALIVLDQITGDPGAFAFHENRESHAPRLAAHGIATAGAGFVLHETAKIA